MIQTVCLHLHVVQCILAWILLCIHIMYCWWFRARQMALWNTEVSPVLKHWRYFSILQSHHKAISIWVRSRNCGCLVTWFCYQLIAKPGNTRQPLFRDLTHMLWYQFYGFCSILLQCGIFVWSEPSPRSLQQSPVCSLSWPLCVSCDPLWGKGKVMK